MKTRSTEGRIGALCCGLRRLRFEALEDRRMLDGVAGEQTIELFNVSPPVFVENQGQWADESVRFVHQGDGVNVAMTDAGPVFQLFRHEGAGFQPAEDDEDDGRLKTYPTETTQFSAHFDGVTKWLS